MAGEDRNLRSLGYEVYRFGGFELMEKNARDSRAVLEPAVVTRSKAEAEPEARLWKVCAEAASPRLGGFEWVAFLVSQLKTSRPAWEHRVKNKRAFL